MDRPRLRRITGKLAAPRSTDSDEGVHWVTELRFRQLVLVYLALNVLMMVAAFFPTYSDELSQAFGDELVSEMGSSLELMLLLSLALIAAWAASVVGLFLFKAWARPLALGFTLASVVTHPLVGTALLSGFESALLEASAVLWGAILTLAYASPLAARFTPAPPAHKASGN